jgi:phosphoribosylaminoimidazole-succinocarboxamide synthase
MAIPTPTDLPLLSSDLPLLGTPRRGKVRDIYDLGDTLLLVATDRISAFDVILPNGIPDKGYVLTQLSLFWFQWLSARGIPHHLLTSDVEKFPEACQPYRNVLAGRSMWVRKVAPLPVECIVRGYLAGSGWKEYAETGTIAGQRMPTGLCSGSRLPGPIFTPSTKADQGAHDQNISFDAMQALCGAKVATAARDLSLAIYQGASAHTESRGLILADTKMEFGLDPETNTLMVIDELLTPDSSRFWPMASEGDHCSQPPQGSQPQVSFDKQFVRDYLLSRNWNGTPPPPPLPDEIIQKTRQKYFEALQRLTGTPDLPSCPNPR